MTEYVAQMLPMLLVAGVAVAWVSEAASRARGHGFMYDLAIGIAGSLVAGLVVSFTMSNPRGMTAMFAVGCLGAALAITGQRKFRAAARLRS